jgi:hypothetical protein
MIPFSPGVAQGCFELLGIVSRTPLSFEQIVTSFSHFSAIKSSEIVAFAQGTGWARSAEDGMAILTPEGARLLSLAGYEPMLRQALLDHIDATRPPWVQCASSGRSRVMAFAGNGVAQIMVEAGLANGFEDEVVMFWDDLAARARGLRDTSLSRIGRIGERLTIAHEESRTGARPKWVAVNSNQDGYDVLSIVGDGDTRLLSIEVKAAAQGISGFMHLTRNEWEMAQERMNHLFHLWDVRSDPPELAKVSVGEMEGHAPSDSGSGRWEAVSIPFAVFRAKFSIA